MAINFLFYMENYCIIRAPYSLLTKKVWILQEILISLSQHLYTEHLHWFKYIPTPTNNAGNPIPTWYMAVENQCLCGCNQDEDHWSWGDLKSCLVPLSEMKEGGYQNSMGDGIGRSSC